jgi:hypothetical protein
MTTQLAEQSVKREASWRERETPMLMLDLMKAALHVNDPRLNALAAELLGRLGQERVREFAHQATNPRIPVERRVASLKAIQAIGVVNDVRISLDLFRLTADNNELIRAAAAQLIEALREIQARVEKWM